MSWPTNGLDEAIDVPRPIREHIEPLKRADAEFRADPPIRDFAIVEPDGLSALLGHGYTVVPAGTR